MTNNIINKTLGKLDKYLHIDTRKYLRNTTYITIGQSIFLLVTLLISILLARSFPTNVYGEYSFILSVFSVIALFSLPGMNKSIIQGVARNYDQVLIEGTKLKLKWSIFGSLAIFIIGLYYLFQNSSFLAFGFIIGSLIFPFLYCFQSFLSYQIGKKQFSKYAKSMLFISSIYLIGTIVVIYYFRDILLVTVIGWSINSLLYIIFYLITAKNIENQNFDEESMTFGKHLTVQNIPNAIIYYGDRIIIGLLLQFSELAIYTVAIAFQTVIREFMVIIEHLLVPEFSQMEEEEAYQVVKDNYVYFVFVVAIFCFIIELICPLIIPFIYSGRYTNSIGYAQLLIVVLIFQIPNNNLIMRGLFASQRKVKNLYKMEFFQLIVEIPLIFLLIINYGIFGVVGAKLISNFCTMVYSWKLFRDR